LYLYVLCKYNVLPIAVLLCFIDVWSWIVGMVEMRTRNLSSPMERQCVPTFYSR